MIPVHLATEDELSEEVLVRLLEATRRYAIGARHRRGGFGYLKSTIKGWNSAAKGCPYVVLTDLDAVGCPPDLIEDWLSVPKHHNLLFRIAVREVEAWLLADRTNFSRFLGIQERSLPTDVEALNDPKATLVALAAKARSRSLRQALVPAKGSTAKQGPAYNSTLVPYVRLGWDFAAASNNSPSLQKTIRRLTEFEPRWER